MLIRHVCRRQLQLPPLVVPRRFIGHGKFLPPSNLALASHLNHLTRQRAHPEKSHRNTGSYNIILTQLRLAVKKRNSLAIIESIVQLHNTELLHWLSAPELANISKVLGEDLFSHRSTGNALNPSQRGHVEHIAIRAAANGAPNLIVFIMAHSIRQDQPMEALRLYEKLHDFVRKQGSPIRVEELGSTKIQEERNPSQDALLDAAVPALIAAYAMQDAFQEALQFFLRSDRRISVSKIREFLTRVKFDAHLRQKTKLYGEKLSIAMLLNTPPLLTRHITNCIARNATADLSSLYHSVIEGMEGPEAFIAPIEAAPTKPVIMTEISWSAFIVAFLKCRREDLAARIWDDMARLGVTPGTATWTALLDTYDNLRQPENALRAWNMIHEQGLQPDALTYRSLISTLLHGRKVEEALHYFSIFQSSLAKQCPPDKSLSVYNTVVHGLLITDQLEKAQAVFHAMRKDGPTPDLVTYNTFLTHYARRQDFKMLAALVEEMGQNQLQGDVFTFSTILSALLRVGREDAPQTILRLMRKQGITPNSATYTAIIDYQMREMNETNLKAALRLLDKMEEDPAARPNEVTYTAILSGLHRSGWLDPAVTERYSQEVLERMKTRNVNFNLPTYHILLKAYLEYPHAEGLQRAQELYQDMRKARITLTHNTWYILLAGLLQRGEWDVADKVIVDMHLLGHQPQRSLLQLVTKVKNRQTLENGT